MDAHENMSMTVKSNMKPIKKIKLFLSETRRHEQTLAHISIVLLYFAAWNSLYFG